MNPRSSANVCPEDVGANQPQPSSHTRQRTATASDKSRLRKVIANIFEKIQRPVGMAGFEPATSCSQSRRANQAALHPVALLVFGRRARRSWQLQAARGHGSCADAGFRSVEHLTIQAPVKGAKIASGSRPFPSAGGETRASLAGRRPTGLDGLRHVSANVLPAALYATRGM